MESNYDDAINDITYPVLAILFSEMRSQFGSRHERLADLKTWVDLYVIAVNRLGLIQPSYRWFKNYHALM